MLSEPAVGSTVKSAKSMRIQVEVQGQEMQFLVDSGTSTCFIDKQRAASLTGVSGMQTAISVKVAGGKLLECSQHLLALEWTCQGHKFSDTFRVLALDSYDGIVGLDWLA